MYPKTFGGVMSTELTILQFKEINTFPSIVAHAGLSPHHLLFLTESKSADKLNGQTLISHLKF
jgi:hypothetical protein